MQEPVREEPLAAVSRRPQRINDTPQQRPCILTLHGLTLDVSKWDHPGGAAVLQRYHGRDATQAFEAAGHSDAARSMLGVLADDQREQEEQQRRQRIKASSSSWHFAIFILLSSAWYVRKNHRLKHPTTTALVMREGSSSAVAGDCWKPTAGDCTFYSSVASTTTASGWDAASHHQVENAME